MLVVSVVLLVGEEGYGLRAGRACHQSRVPDVFPTIGPAMSAERVMHGLVVEANLAMRTLHGFVALTQRFM